MKRKKHYRYMAVILTALLSLRCFAAYATEIWDLPDPVLGLTEAESTAASASDFAEALPGGPSDAFPFTLPEAPLPDITYGTSSADEGTADETYDPYFEENADIYAAVSASDDEGYTAYFDENADIYQAVDFAAESSAAEDGSFMYGSEGEAGGQDLTEGGDPSSYGSSADGTYDLVTAAEPGTGTEGSSSYTEAVVYDTEYASPASGGSADGSNDQSEGIHFTDQSSGSFVNPLYEYLNIDVGLDSSAAETPAFAQSGDLADLPKYGDISSASAYVRNNLKKRNTVRQYLYTDIYTGPGYVDSDIDAAVKSVLLRALDHTGNPTEGDYLFFQFGSASYTSSYLIEGMSYTAQITINMYYYTNASQEAAVTKRVSSVLSGLNLSGKSTYAKVRAIYDYVCSNVRYDYTHLNDPNYLLQFTAYGALINGTAVCQGYAVLLYRMLLEAGIDCRVIQGVGGTDGYTERHAWNIIKIGSLYYCADATWDSPGDGSAVTHSYFLRGNT
ncbi:MAG: transglutaminase domain-containing protein, partial [Lachnospiraceae bacterium]|nr:transglutaminase domain-containing protein [Lachnospiraceae bacterium]